MTTIEQISILVTGGNGQLGSELRRLAPKTNKKYNFIFTDVPELDITNIASVDEFVKSNNVKYIINCAAYTAVDKAEDDVDLCYKINKDAVKNLGEVANANEAKVIHISTDYVFDGTNSRPYTEDEPVCPKSVYGKSKAEGEAILIETCPESIIIRTAWLYSIYGNNFVKTMIRLGREKDTLNVVGDQTGSPTNARDLAQVIAAIIDYSERVSFEAGIYHFSNEGVTTWCEFTKEIHKQMNIQCDVKPITTAEYPTKAQRPQYSVLNKAKIRSTFNLAILPWNESLKECLLEIE